MASPSSSKMNQIYIGVGVLAVVGGLYYMQTKKDAAVTNKAFTQGSKEGAAPQIKVVPEEIDKVSLKAKDKPEIVLEKKDGNWTMVAPTPGARVQKSAVDDILNGLKGLTFKDRIAVGSQNFAGYDLDEGKGIHVVAAKAGTPVVDLWLGATKTRGQMARLGTDASGTVWSVSGISSWTYDKAPKDVRDKKVWDLARENVTAIELKDAKGAFVFAKNESAADAGAADATGEAGTTPAWSGTADGKPLVGLDAAKIDDLLSAFTLGGVLNADDFGDGKSDTETGLASADATVVTFKAKDGSQQKITLGKSEGTKRFARKDGDPTIYLLAESPSAWAEVGTEKFVPAPAAGDAGDAGADAKK
ncbi:MAG: DUF4340 domain-containing protein [Deltaproteobacteria bacterium]|nr:DUF4340 domain-containing protein [Deltaproteobacteria bacterium]